ncbi:MAG: glycosyltransferase [Rhodothermales bacterium]|nr:glycosyltransferase [Rhodothermales bacterium]MBO6779560.1 glycosyltransferase [Rhodothermales bacterium]
MRVLAIHAYYQQFGGEDRMFAADTRLLERRGHVVERFTFDNAEVDGWSRLQQARNVVWNPEQVRRVRAAVASFRPDVAHVQNFFPSLSPAILRALSECGVPVVLRLPNYRLLCVNGTLFRDGGTCTSCVGKRLATSGIRHGCYRGSRLASAGVAAMSGVHRFLGTWNRHVDAYLALDPNGRDLFVQGGLPEERIHVIPNHLETFPEPGTGDGGFAVFSGRLTEEKGLRVLIEAWARLERPVSLKIAGTGPLEDLVRGAASRNPHIEYLGWTEKDELAKIVGRAALAIVPSQWAEPFGLVALEATAAGTPALVTRAGGLQNVVREGTSGWLVEPGDAAQLAAAVGRLFADPAQLKGMRASTRADAASRFSEDAVYASTLQVYRKVVSRQIRPRRAPNPDRLPTRPPGKPIGPRGETDTSRKD